IAWVDEGKGLRVGPMSVGANPGPVCYQRGGKRPTVTDANLILGRLNPNYLLGGRMKVYPLPSKKALIKQICGKTNLGLVEAAAGIVQIVNATMAKILRIVSTERGHDPRCFVLNAFGGAGPMHACALAEELHISDIVVPPHPGLLSALGLLTADLRHSLSRAVMMTAHDVKSSTIKAFFTRLQATGRQALKSQGIQPHAIKFQQLLDMRYAGQGYELTVPLTSSSRSEAFEKAIARFHDRHEAIYGYAAREESVELVNARLVAIGIVAKPKLAKQKLQGTTPPTNALLTKRQVYFEKEKDYDECPVYRRECLKPGNVVYGPAVIEQYDSTTIVYPGWDSRVDGYGNLLITSIGAGMIDA
ncbi:MAG: hydantoinase/oxoprolinase family protein, partial [Candidatus Bathyarchaeota archaeon]